MKKETEAAKVRSISRKETTETRSKQNKNASDINSKMDFFYDFDNCQREEKKQSKREKKFVFVRPGNAEQYEE
jgi:hypothetical protein